MKAERQAKSSRLPYYIGGGVLAVCLIGGIIALTAGGDKKNEPSAQQLAKNDVGDDKRPDAPGKKDSTILREDGRKKAVKVVERSMFLSEQKYLYEQHLGTFFATNGTVLGRKIVVAGEESPHGIFLHPRNGDSSEIAYKLDHNWRTFQCGVAVPRLGDAPEEKGLCLGGVLSFEVAGDGDVLWISNSVRDFDQPQWCEVNVEKVDVLRLRVYCPGNSWCGRAVWVEPRVTTRPCPRPGPVRIEGEDIKVLAKSGEFGLAPQNMSPFRNDKWSGDAQLWCRPTMAGDWVDLELPVAVDGKYQILAHMTRARDYGIVQLSLNGKPLGDPIGLFHLPEVVSTGAIDLGTVRLTTGRAKLRIAVVGTNENSVGLRYMWGLDYVVLQQVAVAD